MPFSASSPGLLLILRMHTNYLATARDIRHFTLPNRLYNLVLDYLPHHHQPANFGVHIWRSDAILLLKVYFLPCFDNYTYLLRSISARLAFAFEELGASIFFGQHLHGRLPFFVSLSTLR